MGSLRTKAEIDAEYTMHAAQSGHKNCLIVEAETQIKDLQGQVQKHLAKMHELRAEKFQEPAAPESTEQQG